MDQASYSNPGCYASSRANCSRKLSGEHFVSESVLRLTGAKAITTTSYPWNQNGDPRTIGISSFTAKVLCTRHNSALSKSDTAARDFAAMMTYFGRQLLTDEELNRDSEEVDVPGEELQRWVLKTLITHSETAVLRAGDRIVRRRDEDRAIEVLFDDARWPRRWGLYVSPSLSSPLTPAHLRTVYGGCQPYVHNDGYLLGGTVWLGGIAFCLALFPPASDDGGPFDGACFRPGAIRFVIGETVKGIRLSWRDGSTHDVLSYDCDLKPVRETGPLTC